MECLVLGARRYDFKDDEGARVEGVTVHYLTLDGSDDPDQRGEIPFSVSAPADLFHQLSRLPAAYDLDFRQRPGRGGKPTLSLVGAEYVGEASLVGTANGTTE